MLLVTSRFCFFYVFFNVSGAERVEHSALQPVDMPGISMTVNELQQSAQMRTGLPIHEWDEDLEYPLKISGYGSDIPLSCTYNGRYGGWICDDKCSIRVGFESNPKVHGTMEKTWCQIASIDPHACPDRRYRGHLLVTLAIQLCESAGYLYQYLQDISMYKCADVNGTEQRISLKRVGLFATGSTMYMKHNFLPVGPDIGNPFSPEWCKGRSTMLATSEVARLKFLEAYQTVSKISVEQALACSTDQSVGEGLLDTFKLLGLDGNTLKSVALGWLYAAIDSGRKQQETPAEWRCSAMAKWMDLTNVFNKDTSKDGCSYWEKAREITQCWTEFVRFSKRPLDA